jgi:hypothetical protein
MKPDSEFWDIHEDVLQLQALKEKLEAIDTSNYFAVDLIVDAQVKVYRLTHILLQLQRELI